MSETESVYVRERVSMSETERTSVSQRDTAQVITRAPGFRWRQKVVRLIGFFMPDASVKVLKIEPPKEGYF